MRRRRQTNKGAERAFSELLPAAAEVVNIVYNESYAYSITLTEQSTELGNFSSNLDEIYTKCVIKYD